MIVLYPTSPIGLYRTKQFVDLYSVLGTLAKTRNFLALQNMTSAVKFSFLYDRDVLFENCTVFDIYEPNITKAEVNEYERLSEEFKTKTVDKDEFSKMNLSSVGFNPPYVQSRNCKEIGDIYLRTGKAR